MFEPVEWSTWNVEVAKKIRRLAGLVVDLAAEYEGKPRTETMEALRSRIDLLAALAEDLMAKEPSALHRQHFRDDPGRELVAQELIRKKQAWLP